MQVSKLHKTWPRREMLTCEFLEKKWEMPLLLFSTVSAKCHTVNQSHISLLPPTASVCPQASAPPWAEWTVIRLLFSTTRQRVTERQIGPPPLPPSPLFSPRGRLSKTPRESKREKNFSPLLPPLPAWSQRLSPPSPTPALFYFCLASTSPITVAFTDGGEREEGLKGTRQQE